MASAQPRFRITSEGPPAWALRTLGLLAIAATWELAGRASDPLFFVPLSKVLPALWITMTSGELATSMWLSGQALVLGYVPAVVLGIPAGMVIGRFRAVDDALNPYLVALLSTPMIAVAPLLLFALGIDVGARAGVVFAFAVVLVVVNSAAGIRGTDLSLLEMSRAYGASSPQQFVKIMLPSALPGIFAGLRLGLGQALTGMIASEFIITAVGLGKQIMTYSGRFRTDFLLATVLAVIVVAMLMFWLVTYLERKVAPWASHELST